LKAHSKLLLLRAAPQSPCQITCTSLDHAYASIKPSAGDVRKWFPAD